MGQVKGFAVCSCGTWYGTQLMIINIVKWSMAMQQVPIDWRYQSHILPAYFSGLNFRGYTPKIWPEKWYSTSILGSWNSHWNDVSPSIQLYHLVGTIIKTYIPRKDQTRGLPLYIYKYILCVGSRSKLQYPRHTIFLPIRDRCTSLSH
jgi:hypothetical protein